MTEPQQIHGDTEYVGHRTTPRPTAYICGPMRGYAEYNFPMFDEAAAAATQAGYRVLSPAAADRADGFDPTGLAMLDCLDYGDFDEPAAMRRDIGWLLNEVDVVILLPDWRESTNATLEHAIATVLRLEVIEWKLWRTGLPLIGAPR